MLVELERKLAAEVASRFTPNLIRAHSLGNLHRWQKNGEKDIVFNRELATRGIVRKEQLILLLDATPVDQAVRGPIRDHIERDFR